MPNFPHFILLGFLLYVLGVHVRNHNLGFVGPELRCVFGPMTCRRGYVPDIAFISRERVPRGDARSFVPFRLPPDFVIEVLSPEQNVGRFTEKLQFYLRHGVRLVWVVDPIAETVTVHRPDDDPVTLTAGDTLDGADVVPGFTLPVADIFAQLTLDGE
jgi:Uma2 family endonuclease